MARAVVEDRQWRLGPVVPRDGNDLMEPAPPTRRPTTLLTATCTTLVVALFLSLYSSNPRSFTERSSMAPTIRDPSILTSSARLWFDPISRPFSLHRIPTAVLRFHFHSSRSCPLCSLLEFRSVRRPEPSDHPRFNSSLPSSGGETKTFGVLGELRSLCRIELERSQNSSAVRTCIPRLHRPGGDESPLMAVISLPGMPPTKRGPLEQP